MSESARLPVGVPKAPFARFALRMAAVAIDFVLILFSTQLLHDYILRPMGITGIDNRPVVLALAFVYFLLCWLSPMRATLTQFLFGLSVVDESGETLGVARAALRSVALLVLISGAFALFEVHSQPYLALLGLVAYVILFLAAVTPKRQAGHDRLAHSIVVRRSALNSPPQKKRLLEYMANSDSTPVAAWKPTTIGMLVDAFILGVPVFMLLIFAGVENDKDLSHRTNYAVGSIQNVRLALEEYYSYTGGWTLDESELGTPTRGDYPDGGYYEVEEGGVIRIRFTVKPQLTEGSIVMRPVVTDDGITWQCSSEGDIADVHLPANCRN